MGNGLFRELENRLLRGKALAENINSQKNSGLQQQTSLELFMRRRYSTPERPDVEVEQKVWALRSPGEKAGHGLTAKHK